MGNEYFRYGESADAAASNPGAWKQRTITSASLAEVLAIALGGLTLRPEPAEAVGRFFLVIRDDPAPTGNINISPDGSAMAFTAPISNGDLQL